MFKLTFTHNDCLLFPKIRMYLDTFEIIHFHFLQIPSSKTLPFLCVIKLNVFLSISNFCFLGEIYLVTLRCFQIIANSSGAARTRSGSVFSRLSPLQGMFRWVKLEKPVKVGWSVLVVKLQGRVLSKKVSIITHHPSINHSIN